MQLMLLNDAFVGVKIFFLCLHMFSNKLFFSSGDSLLFTDAGPCSMDFYLSLSLPTLFFVFSLPDFPFVGHVLLASF